MKLCKDCKWRVRDSFGLSLCGSPHLTGSLVTGKADQHCESERRSGPCGFDGKFWASKEPRVVNEPEPIVKEPNLLGKVMDWLDDQLPFKKP